jgi:hypothetical protein
VADVAVNASDARYVFGLNVNKNEKNLRCIGGKAAGDEKT